MRRTPRPRTLSVDALELRTLFNAAFDITDLTALRADPAYAAIDGQGVILDTGVYGSNPDLVGNFAGFVDILSNRAAVAPLVTSPSGSSDHNGHGSHVAGTVASTDPEIGVATGAKFISLRVLPGAGDPYPNYDTVAEGLNWVLLNYRRYGISVVNMSIQTGGVNANAKLGGQEGQMIASLEAAGITIVTADGNDYADFRTAGASSPATDSTIGVISTWKDSGQNDSLPVTGGVANGKYYSVDSAPQPDQISAFSQRSSLGNQIAAPGETIYSTWNGDGGNLYNLESGTSQASPFVAGVVALMQDAAQTFGGSLLSPSQVLQILRQTGDTIVDSTLSTNGIVDDDGNSFDLPETGLSFPRVNVYRAVQAVRSLFVHASGDADATLQSAFHVPPIAPGDGYVMSDRNIGNDGSLLVGPADVDMFRVELTSAASIKFQLASVSGLPTGHFVVRLFGSAGAELFPTTDPSGYPGTSTTQAPPGIYYVGVSGEANASYDANTGSGATAASTGYYSLTVSAVTSDPDGALGGAQQVSLLDIADFDDANVGFANVDGAIGTDDTAVGGTADVGASDVDMYVFTAPDSGFVDLAASASSSSLDAYLNVFDPDGNLLAFNDDGGGNHNALLHLPVTVGITYYVGVSSFGGSVYDATTTDGRTAGSEPSSGAYSFHLTFTNGDVNATALTPTLITNGTLSASLGDDGATHVGARDVDFYAVASGAAGTMTFSAPSSASSVLTLYRFDSDAEELLQLGRVSGTSNRLQIAVGPDDVFWVAVTGTGNEDYNWYATGSGSGGLPGTYTLTTSVTPGAPTSSDNTLSSARAVTAGTTLAASVGRDGTLILSDAANDVDVYSYVASNSGLATVHVRGVGDDALDTYVRIFDAAGNEVAFNDDQSDSSTDSAVTFDAVAGQTYYVGITSYSPDAESYVPATGAGVTGGISSGDYTFRLDQQPYPALSVSDASANEGGALSFTVTLSAPLDADVTFDYSTRDGSAAAGRNYLAASGPVTIAAGETTATITIQTLADNAVTGPLVFSLDLSGPMRATLSRASANGSIANLDVPPNAPDLNGSFNGFPSAFQPGVKSNAISVNIKNTGTVRAKATVHVQLYASLDTTFDSSDILIADLNQKLNLPASFGLVQPTFKIPSPSVVPDGSYHIVMVLDTSNLLGDANRSDNAVVSPGVVSIAAPFIDIASSLALQPTAVKPRGAAFATLRLVNNGNVASTGGATLNLRLSPTSAGDDNAKLAGALFKKLKLKPGQFVLVKVKLLNASAPGNYYLDAATAYVGTPPDRDASNNTVFSTTPIAFG